MKIKYALQKTFGQWLRPILIPYRQSLGKAHLPMLLLMDGHKTHFCQANVQYCNENNITCVALPAHTSHILQPLDVGIFNVFKAAFRRAVADPALAEVIPQEASDAAKERVRMIGRSLIAHVNSTTARHIRRAFLKTGIYPINFHTFLLNSRGVRDVPGEVTAAANAELEAKANLRKEERRQKQRRDVRDGIIIVHSN